MVLPLSCFRRIQFGAFGGKGVTEHSFYFCPRFQNDTGSEVWGFCVFYRQDAGIGFLPCCKWRSVSAHRSLTRLIHLLFKFRKYAPHALNQRSPAEGKGKGQKLLAQGNAGCTELYPHALKGQKLLAQGNALGTVDNQQDAL